jgi:hypothetical protein
MQDHITPSFVSQPSARFTGDDIVGRQSGQPGYFVVKLGSAELHLRPEDVRALRDCLDGILGERREQVKFTLTQVIGIAALLREMRFDGSGEHADRLEDLLEGIQLTAVAVAA